VDNGVYEKLLEQVKRGYKLLFHRDCTITEEEHPSGCRNFGHLELQDGKVPPRAFIVDESFIVSNEVQQKGRSHRQVEVWYIDRIVHHPGSFNPHDGGTPPETDFVEEITATDRPVADLLYLLAKYEVEAVLLTLMEDELEESCKE